MKSTDDRKLFGTLIGASAASGDIETIPATQTTTGNGRASIALAFPPETFTARSAGGNPPYGSDMNGFLNLLSNAIQVLQSGFLGPFDATFAQSIGGYPAGAIVSGSVAGTFWVSTADANVSVPGATGATWQSLFNGYATEAWANGQFLQLAAAGLQTVTGPVTFSGITTVPTPTDYSKKQAIGASDADGRYVQKTGDTMTGALGVTTFSGSTSSGAECWSTGIMSTITGRGTEGAYGPVQASFYATEWVGSRVTAKIQVDGYGIRSDYDFPNASYNGGRIIAPAGTMAVTSDLPTAGTITGGTYTKTPLNDGTGRSVLRQKFTVTIPAGTGTSDHLISFPFEYSSVPSANATSSRELNGDQFSTFACLWSDTGGSSDFTTTSGVLLRINSVDGAGGLAATPNSLVIIVDVEGIVS